MKRVDPNAKPAAQTFEVASVKRVSGQLNNNSSMRMDPGRLTITNAGLKSLLRRAYDVLPYQITGPDWLDTETYDITATLPASATSDEFMAMMQNLLAERFKVKVHRESREMAVYAMVQEKGGHKMRIAQFGQSRLSMQNDKFEAMAIPMRNLANFLTQQMGRPVLDMTGLKGYFSFTMTYARDEAPAAPGTDGTPTAAPVGPSLERALREQVGLRLEARRAPVEFLVVDSAEKVPTEN